MPAVSGPQFLSDPDGEALAPPPSRYQWQGSYWSAIKHGRWPNVTGWVEQREAQRIHGPMLEQLLVGGVPKDEERHRARGFAQAELLTLTTARKEASDRLYARNRAAQNLQAPDPSASTPSTEAQPPPTSSVPSKGVISDE